MTGEKQFVFSARTTEEGLKRLGEVRAKLGGGWDEMVIEAVSAHYNLDKATLTLPKKAKTSKAAEENQQPPAKTENEAEPVGETVGERPTETVQEIQGEEKPAKRHNKGGKKNTKKQTAATGASGNAETTEPTPQAQ